MYMKCESVSIPAPMKEFCTQLLTLFQANDNRLQTRTSYSLTVGTAGVVRVVRKDRLFTLLSLHLRHPTRTALIHKKRKCVMGSVGASSSFRRYWFSFHAWSAVMTILGGLNWSSKSSPNARWSAHRASDSP